MHLNINKNFVPEGTNYSKDLVFIISFSKLALGICVRIVEQYYAPRSVSRYCSNLWNDSLIAQNLVNLYIVTK